MAAPFMQSFGTTFSFFGAAASGIASPEVTYGTNPEATLETGVCVRSVTVNPGVTVDEGYACISSDPTAGVATELFAGIPQPEVVLETPGSFEGCGPLIYGILRSTIVDGGAGPTYTHEYPWDASEWPSWSVQVERGNYGTVNAAAAAWEINGLQVNEWTITQEAGKVLAFTFSCIAQTATRGTAVSPVPTPNTAPIRAGALTTSDVIWDGVTYCLDEDATVTISRNAERNPCFMGTTDAEPSTGTPSLTVTFTRKRRTSPSDTADNFLDALIAGTIGAFSMSFTDGTNVFTLSAPFAQVTEHNGDELQQQTPTVSESVTLTFLADPTATDEVVTVDITNGTISGLGN